MPRLLTINQKRQRVRDSKSCFDLFNRNQSDFLRRLVSSDGTWIHHYAPESKQQAKQWVGPGETVPKRADTTIGLKGYGFCLLGFQWHIVHRLFGESKNNQQRLLLCIIGAIDRRNYKKTPSFVEGKMYLFARIK